jgi:hypothetical protein
MVSFPGRTHFYLFFYLCGQIFSQLATLMGQKKNLSTGFFVQKLCMLRALTVPAHRTCLNPLFKNKIVRPAQLVRGCEHLGFRKTGALSINRTGTQKLAVTIE